jgi:O-antigen ligase
VSNGQDERPRLVTRLQWVAIGLLAASLAFSYLGDGGASDVASILLLFATACVFVVGIAVQWFASRRRRRRR